MFDKHVPKIMIFAADFSKSEYQGIFLLYIALTNKPSGQSGQGSLGIKYTSSKVKQEKYLQL